MFCFYVCFGTVSWSKWPDITFFLFNRKVLLRKVSPDRVHNRPTLPMLDTSRCLHMDECLVLTHRNWLRYPIPKDHYLYILVVPFVLADPNLYNSTWPDKHHMCSNRSSRDMGSTDTLQQRNRNQWSFNLWVQTYLSFDTGNCKLAFDLDTIGHPNSEQSSWWRQRAYNNLFQVM